MLRLTWQENKGEVIYKLNDNVIGEGEDGFKNFLKELSGRSEKKLVIEFPVTHANSGLSMEETLPFYKRLNEFQKLVNEKKILVEYQPSFR